VIGAAIAQGRHVASLVIYQQRRPFQHLAQWAIARINIIAGRCACYLHQASGVAHAPLSFSHGVSVFPLLLISFSFAAYSRQTLVSAGRLRIFLL
jgi:hypothetical protein